MQLQIHNPKAAESRGHLGRSGVRARKVEIDVLAVFHRETVSGTTNSRASWQDHWHESRWWMVALLSRRASDTTPGLTCDLIRFIP
jgi:hypothetical protein